MTIKRRFIAGAVCPRCGAQDRIVVVTGEDGPESERRECVECGFSEARGEAEGQGGATPSPAPSAGALPPGRLDAPRRPAAADKAQPIRFFPRPPGRGKDAASEEGGDGGAS